MPSQVPPFTMNTYIPIMDIEFEAQESVQWISIWEALATVQDPFVKTYANLDARNL
jgi:hypothetical protein